MKIFRWVRFIVLSPFFLLLFVSVSVVMLLQCEEWDDYRREVKDCMNFFLP